MLSVALYARYSSELQRDASIEDQLRLCRERAEREGWRIADSYSDRSISGASLLRPGIQALMEDGQRQRFDIVLSEALDRISRDQEEIAGVYKRLTFAGVRMVTLSEGDITELHIGLKGTMGALYIKDLADKTRRGLRGRVEDGKSGGGNSYGYRVVHETGDDGELIRGGRTIDPEQAAVVNRIFTEYAAGRSPREIAHRFNAEGIAGPRGTGWGPSTIHGSVKRCNGILNNELYIGRIVWNRQRFIKDPDTGKRVSRPNPEEEWITRDVPELRIAARRRRELGRDVLLVDPFAVVRGHKAAYGDALYLPASASAAYNPLDFIRGEEALAVRDIHVLLDALLTPPPNDAHQNTRHFYESARAIIAGYVAWVRFHEPPGQRTLGRVYELLSQPPAGREQLAARVMEVKRFAGGLAHIAFERQAQVGPEEGGGTFTTIANQLAFLNFPELVADTAVSSFDPMMLAEGNTDLFVVAPEELIDHVKGWLRLWVTVPNAVASRRALARDLLIIIDEMPRLGYLKPVMDGYNMAAGKGVHFWCFAQSLSALDDTWGEGRRKTLMYLAEVVQILGLPRADPDGAEQLSKAIGGATFESRTENRSGSVAGVGVVEANTQWQAGESYSLVRERLVMPDELMTLGPDRQYVITTSKDMPRDALHLHHARYWRRPDAGWLADPNPFVLRKENSSGARALRQQRQRDPDGAVFAPGPGDKTHG